MTIDAEALEALLHPVFDPASEFEVLTTGVAAAPGAARGAIVLSAAEAVRRAADGEDVILVRPFTEADDIAGFHAARGDPHRPGRQGLARGARRPRHGASLRHRRLGGQGRRRGRGGADRRRGARRRRHDRDRGHDRPRDRRRRAADRARDRRQLRRGPRLVGRPAPPRGAGQRRHRRGRGQGAVPGRRGDRPLPDRAHVLRRGPGRAGPRDVRRRGALAAGRGASVGRRKGGRRPELEDARRGVPPGARSARRAPARRLRRDPASRCAGCR